MLLNSYTLFGLRNLFHAYTIFYDHLLLCFVCSSLFIYSLQSEQSFYVLYNPNSSYVIHLAGSWNLHSHIAAAVMTRTFFNLFLRKKIFIFIHLNLIAIESYKAIIIHFLCLRNLKNDNEHLKKYSYSEVHLNFFFKIDKKFFFLFFFAFNLAILNEEKIALQRCNWMLSEYINYLSKKLNGKF